MSHTENITKLEQFIKMMTGHFDNQEQFQKMKEAGEIYPLWKKVIIKAKENVILRHICFC